MRSSKISIGQYLALGGGLVMVVALFLPWFDHRELGEGIPNFVRSLYFWDFSVTVFGWDLRLTLFAVILVLLAAALMAVRVSGLSLPNVGETTAGQLAFLLAVAGAVVILVKLLVGEGLDEGLEALVREFESSGLTLADLGLDIANSPDVGIYLGLAGGALVAIGSLLAMRTGDAPRAKVAKPFADEAETPPAAD